RKRLIRDSRVLGTRHLVEGIAAADPRPRVLLSASAVGYYGDREEILDESAGPGEDFLAGVVKAWEDEAAKAEALGLRVILLRIGVVLARDGGALAKMLPAFRMGVAGRLGHGRQGMPWVHVDDVVGLILHALDHPEIRGPVNAVAPEIVDNAGFTRALGKALHRPTVLPAPGFMLRLALGEMAGVLLGGQRLVPRVAERTGYQFRHPELTEALGSLLANPTGPDPATERASS
ncbi:MAG TPA: TIGR01777 family oxidoreductase, partial [Polyangia bacterium]|nr:TIGR01777 family oxidoreductase [Polyangia bacterium]